MPPLPPQPAGQTNLPPAPQIPPTHVDIAEAIEYNKRANTRDDVARGALYETTVIAAEHAGAAVAPAWFAPIRDQLNRIERAVNVSYNLSCRDGRTRPFKVVPFLNGDLPTDAAHGLRPLHNEGDIDILLNQEASDYQTGYQGQVAHLAADRKRQIRLEIGCTTGL